MKAMHSCPALIPSYGQALHSEGHSTHAEPQNTVTGTNRNVNQLPIRVKRLQPCGPEAVQTKTRSLRSGEKGQDFQLGLRWNGIKVLVLDEKHIETWSLDTTTVQ